MRWPIPAPEPHADCRPEDHPPEAARRPISLASLDRASQLFRAMGDLSRLRILDLLRAGELCVTEIVDALGEKFPTVSARLRLLRTEGLIARRRDGNHIYYALADRHVVDLIHNAVEHANELNSSPDPGED